MIRTWLHRVMGALVASAGLLSGVAWAQPASWTERTPVEVVNTSPADLTDHQVRLEFDTASLIAEGRLRSDAADLRFGVEPDGTTPIPYWIESGVNTASTVVWIAVPNVPSDSRTAVWMYFGNPAAAPESALDVVFPPSEEERDDSSTLQVDNGGAGGVGDSQRGFRFAPNEDVLVVSFGKREPTGTTRYITLFDNATQTILQQRQITGPAGEYTYDPLPEPIWLRQGQQYILLMHQAANDGYYYGTSTQIHPSLTYLDMRYCNGCDQNTFPQNFLNAIHYGYPDMLLRTRKPASPQPTGSVGDVASHVAVQADVNPSILGDDVVLTAEVTAALEPTGTVAFRVDGTDVCVDIPLTGGLAQCTLSDLALGAHIVEVSYSGAQFVQPGSGTHAHDVVILPPGPPTGLVVTPGNLQLTVDMTPPQFLGGSAITAYTVVCTDGVDQFAGAAAVPPVVVGNLVNGTVYTCGAYATNAAGDGAPSDPIDGMPSTVPDAPTSVSALSGEGQATLTFVSPGYDGGVPILGYTAVCVSASGTVQANGAGSPLVITGLTNGVNYDCAVRAYNIMGDGPLSDSVAVFPQSVPEAPVIVAAVAGDMQATLYFDAPASDGGSPILRYDALCSDGVVTMGAIGAGSPVTVAGLANFTTYSCVVLARNALGDGPASAAVSVTPPDNVLFFDGFESIDVF